MAFHWILSAALSQSSNSQKRYTDAFRGGWVHIPTPPRPKATVIVVHLTAFLVAVVVAVVAAPQLSQRPHGGRGARPMPSPSLQLLHLFAQGLDEVCRPGTRCSQDARCRKKRDDSLAAMTTAIHTDNNDSNGWQQRQQTTAVPAPANDNRHRHDGNRTKGRLMLSTRQNAPRTEGQHSGSSPSFASSSCMSQVFCSSSQATSCSSSSSSSPSSSGSLPPGPPSASDSPSSSILARREEA